MKKFLRAISLLLTVVMFMAMVPAYATETSAEASYTVPSNVKNVWYAGDAITAKEGGFIDFGITEGEYTPLFVNKTRPVAYLNTYTAAQIAAGKHNTNTEGGYNSCYDDVVADDFYDEANRKRVSAEMDFYVSYDDEYIYIAFRDLGGAYDFDGNGTIDKTEYSFRSNYVINFGLNLEDTTKYLALTGSGEFDVFKYVIGGDTHNAGVAIPNNAILKDYQFTKYAVNDRSKYILDNTNMSWSGMPHDQYEAFAELKLSKDELLAFSNMYCGTNYAEFPNAMFISMAEKSYFWTEANGVASNKESLWVGSTTQENPVPNDTNNVNTFDWAPDMVVFGKQGTEVTVPAAPTASSIAVGPQTVHYAGAQRSVSMDGYVGADEYLLNYTLSQPSLFMTNDGFYGVKSWVPTSDRLTSEEVTFSFAHDADNIYFAVTDVGGNWGDIDPYTVGYAYRCNYQFRLGFTFGDTDVFVNINHNNEACISTSGGVVKIASGQAAFINKYSDSKYLLNADGSIGKYLGNSGKNSEEGQYIAFKEYAIDKDAILEFINANLGKNYAELPGAMYFTMCARTYTWAKEEYRNNADYTNVASNGDKKTYKYGRYSLDTVWMASSPLASKTYNYLPDVVVFGEEGTAVETPCNFNVKTENESTLMAACASNDLYYYSCACGKIANGGADVGGYLSYFVGTTDATADHTPNIPEATDTEDKVCTTCLAVLDEAKGHVHTYADSYATDGTQHWKECACGAKAMVGAHNGTPCTTCGYGASAAPSTPVTPPAETTPVETQPAETTPVETQPAETTPTETTPVETQPAETTPAETEPAETEPAATEPAETEPVATEPAETEPADEAGCAGAISFMGLALVATLGACGVIATKKKED